MLVLGLGGHEAARVENGWVYLWVAGVVVGLVRREWVVMVGAYVAGSADGVGWPRPK